MSKFKVPADQPDFEIELTATGAKDSEGNSVGAGDIDLSVDSSNPDAVDASIKSQTLSEDGNSVTAVLSVHVGSPEPDSASLNYQARNRDTDALLASGSDEFLVGVGEAATLGSITSSVPLTAEPEAAPAPAPEPPPAEI